MTQEYERIELTPLRKAIAEKMTESKATIPHALTKVSVDATDLLRFRAANKERWIAERGFCPTPFAFVAYAAVQAVGYHKLINSSFKGDHLAQFSDCNLAITMEVAGKGLMAPVVHKAQAPSFWDFAKTLHELTRKAKAGDLKGMRFQGATFTVNNPGAYGSEDGYSVIMPPQAAILSMRKITETPIAYGNSLKDQVVIRAMMPLGLSFDHRVMDGKEATEYLLAVREFIEDIKLVAQRGLFD